MHPAPTILLTTRAAISGANERGLVPRSETDPSLAGRQLTILPLLPESILAISISFLNGSPLIQQKLAGSSAGNAR